MQQMKKTVVLVWLLVAAAVQAQEYKLVWEDNFDGSKLNNSNWTIAENGEGGGNRELQYYYRKNIKIAKEPVTGAKCLVITAKKQRYLSHPATSGRLSTAGKISFRYGKVEARIKFPKTANGLWPAFWMLGANHAELGWPKCGEIDIMEMGHHDGIANETQERYFNGACHWGEAFNNGGYPNYAKMNTCDYSLQDDFHLFTLIWDENLLSMYVDLDKNPAAKPYYELPLGSDETIDKPARYFHKPFFVLFNIAVGGNFTKIWDIKNVTALENGDAKMYVDYVRIYQKGIAGEELFVPKN